MSQINQPIRYDTPRTHEGAPAMRLTAEQELRRLVAACLLWEDNFYEGGVEIAGRIKELVPKCRTEFLAECAMEARTKQKLRHVPLLLVREMARTKGMKSVVGQVLPEIIQRADELSEFMAIYWKDGKAPLSKQVKKGLARAFVKFDEYQLAKYNRNGAVKLRDVLFMCHAKPQTPEQDALWKRLIDGKLETPDTWEVRLSEGADKRETFERLMAENNLGALAFLRNMRNMREAGVPEEKVVEYAGRVDIARVLPFRFIAAARAVPAWEHILEPMMLRACEGRPKLTGKTKVLIDVSGSMAAPVSGRSDINRMDAACGVAILLRELCDDVDFLTFSNHTKEVPSRRGFALRDALINSQPHSSTHLGAAVEHVNRSGYNRLVVFTDEQSHDRVGAPKGVGYMINVASHRNGVGYGAYNHIDGWSEAVIDYILEIENLAK